MSAEKESILIYRIGSMGDILVALPCFHAIRRRFPEARRLLLTNIPVSQSAPAPLSVLGPDFIDAVIPYPLGTRSPADLLSLMRTIRTSGVRTAVYLMPERSFPAIWRDWLFLRASGIHTILGFPDTADLRRPRFDPVSGMWEQESRRLVRCCAPYLGPIDVMAPENLDLRLTASERARARSILAPLGDGDVLAINMGGKKAYQDWGHANWCALIDRLGSIKDRPPGLLVVGARDSDHARAEDVISHWPGLAINACGLLSPRETAAALARARLFIGHDTGPMHLAGCVGTPTIGLFDPLSPLGAWTPLGQEVTVLYDSRGVSALSVETVTEAAVAMLRKAN